MLRDPPTRLESAEITLSNQLSCWLRGFQLCVLLAVSPPWWQQCLDYKRRSNGLSSTSLVRSWPVGLCFSFSFSHILLRCLPYIMSSRRHLLRLFSHLLFYVQSSRESRTITFYEQVGSLFVLPPGTAEKQRAWIILEYAYVSPNLNLLY